MEEEKQPLKKVKKWAEKWKRRWRRADAEERLGDVYFHQSNFTEAKKCYKRALKLDSQNIVHYDNLGDTLTELNENKKAIKYYKKGLKHFPDSNYFSIHYNCGRTFNIMKKYNEAIPHFRSAIKIDPTKVYAYTSLSNSYFHLHRFKESIEISKKAIEISPDISSSYNRIGDCYLKLGLIEEGISYLKRVIEIEPHRAAGYFNLGTVLDDKKRYDESITYFKKSIKIDPDYVSSYNNLGFTYTNIHDYDNAIEQFKEVIKRDSSSTDGYLNLGDTFYFLGKYKEALEQHKKADKLLKLRKTNILVQSCTAFALIKLKKYKKAKFEIQSCFSIPKNSFDLFCYGFVLYKLKKYQSSSLNLFNSIVAGPVEDFDREYTSKTKYYYAMTLIKLKENNWEKIIENFNDSIAAEPNWSKVYYRIAQFLSLKYPIEKKEEIKSNYLFAVEKNNLAHPCDRLSQLKIIKILETVSLL